MALNDLYGDGHTVQLAKGGKDDFDHTTFDNAAQHVYTHGGFNAHMMSDADVRALTRETYRVLSSAIGLKQEVPDDLRRLLEESTFVFSGFKTYHELREVSALMQAEDGGIKSWDKFSQEVFAIDNRYNRNYLHAEYNFAVQSAQMAAKWKDFEKDGDEYLLQYRTAGDDKVRAEHAVLHNTTLPIDDPFWDEYLPPLDWGCRCTTVQVLRDKYPVSDSAEAIAAGERATDTPKKKIFRFNPGKSGNLFPPKHPYFKLTQQDKPVVKQAIEAQVAEDREQQWMDELPDTLTPEQKKAIVQNFKDIEAGLGVVKGKPMSVEKADEQSANPHYAPEFLVDPNGIYKDAKGILYSKNPKYKKRYTINCATCAPAYMLRLRGFDVKAKGRVAGSGSLNDSVAHNRSFEMWKNADGTASQPTLTAAWMQSKGYASMNAERYREYFNEACAEQGVYVLTIGWRKGGGHATILLRDKDGELYYIEPQAYDSQQGARRTIDELCNDGSEYPLSKRGVLRIDDKIFDTSFLPLFDI